LKRHHLFIMIFTLVIIIAGGVVAVRSEEKSELLFKEMLTTFGAELELSEINYWTQLREYPGRPEQAEQLIEDVASRIGLLERSAVKTKSLEGGYLFEVSGMLCGGGQAELSLQGLAAEEQAYLFVHLETESCLQGAADKGLRLQTVLADLGFGGQNSISLLAAVEKQLTLLEMEELAFQMVDFLEGEVKEKINDGNLISLTAYSPLVSEYVLSADNKPINLNLAMRYDSYRGKTRIWIGVPLIEGAY
jgi:hypothetical protein